MLSNHLTNMEWIVRYLLGQLPSRLARQDLGASQCFRAQLPRWYGHEVVDVKHQVLLNARGLRVQDHDVDSSEVARDANIADSENSTAKVAVASVFDDGAHGKDGKEILNMAFAGSPSFMSNWK